MEDNSSAQPTRNIGMTTGNNFLKNIIPAIDSIDRLLDLNSIDKE